MIKLKNLSIKVTTDYLKKYPTAAADGAKTKKEQIANIENAYSKVISPNIQTTKPDYLVSELLEHLYGYPKEKRKLNVINELTSVSNSSWLINMCFWLRVLN